MQALQMVPLLQRASISQVEYKNVDSHLYLVNSKST
jgi:hypothetical protein